MYKDKKNHNLIINYIIRKKERKRTINDIIESDIYSKRPAKTFKICKDIFFTSYEVFYFYASARK